MMMHISTMFKFKFKPKPERSTTLAGRVQPRAQSLNHQMVILRPLDIRV